MSALDRLTRGVTDVEETVCEIGTFTIPLHEAPANITEVNTPQFLITITDCNCHRHVVAPRASRLVVAVMADHVRAAERTPQTELVRNAGASATA